MGAIVGYCDGGSLCGSAEGCGCNLAYAEKIRREMSKFWLTERSKILILNVMYSHPNPFLKSVQPLSFFRPFGNR